MLPFHQVRNGRRYYLHEGKQLLHCQLVAVQGVPAKKKTDETFRSRPFRWIDQPSYAIVSRTLAAVSGTALVAVSVAPELASTMIDANAGL